MMAGTLIVVFGSSLPSTTKKEKKYVKSGPSLSKLSGSAHDLSRRNLSDV